MYKTFPIYHSFKEKSFYRNVNSYGFSESLYDAPCIHYFYLQTQYEFSFLHPSRVVNNKTIVFGPTLILRRRQSRKIGFPYVAHVYVSCRYIPRVSVQRRWLSTHARISKTSVILFSKIITINCI